MIVIGIDAHKRAHTMVAVDASGAQLGVKTVQATSAGHFAGLQWARGRFGSELCWAVEDVRTLTRRLEQDLMDAGHNVVRVPPHLMAHTRRSDRERGKSDPIDARAVARAALAHPELPVARHTQWSREIKLIADHRENLIEQRTAITNRLLWHIHELDPTHTIKNGSLSYLKNQRALAEWLGGHHGVVADIASAQARELSRLTLQAAPLERQLATLVAEACPSLLQLYGCSTLLAAKIIGEVADVRRFRSEAAFASYAGLAPVPHWSGSSEGTVRASRGGNRALNSALHMIAMTQVKTAAPGYADYQRRVDVDKEARGTALRRVRRRVARTVYRRLLADAKGEPIRHLLNDLDQRSARWREICCPGLDFDEATMTFGRPSRRRSSRKTTRVEPVDNPGAEWDRLCAQWKALRVECEVLRDS